MNEELISEILRLDIKPEDYWRDRGEIPLLMKKPFNQYPDNDIPDKDIGLMDINKYYNDWVPMHMLVIGKSRMQKTRLMKRVVLGAYKAGYKILVIEPKEFEWVRGRYKGTGKRLHKMDKNTSLPVISYTPSAFHSYLHRISSNDKGEIVNREYIDNTNFYSLNINQLDYREIWMSFGVPAKAADFIVNQLQQGKNTIPKLKHSIIFNKEMMANTRNAAISALDNLEGTNVFDSRFKKLNIEKEWNKEKVVIINYHGRQGSYMNTDIGLIIAQIKNISQREKVKTKKLIVLDDSFMYLGAEAYKFARAEINYAQVETANCQYNYAKFGMDTIIIIQNLDSASILTTLVEGRTEFLITQTGNSEILKNLVNYDVYFLATNRNESKGRILHVDRKQWLFQWIYTNDEGDKFVGYPFDCTIGHS